MNLQFNKMNGAGNDFVLIDNRDGKIKLTRDQVVHICHRQRGVGADGLMLLIPCASGKSRNTIASNIIRPIPGQLNTTSTTAFSVTRIEK